MSNAPILFGTLARVISLNRSGVVVDVSTDKNPDIMVRFADGGFHITEASDLEINESAD